VSLTPATADIGDVVTIDGTGMTFGELSVLVLVDGVALPDLYVDDVAETAIGMTMPDLGGAGDYVITVSVGGVESNPLTYTQNADQAPDEPANDAPATATPVTLPADIVGSFSADDVEDFYEFTLAADGDVTVTVQWTGVGGFEGKDLDLIVQPAATAIQIDGAQSQYGNDVCGNTGATFPHPPDAETAVCEGLTAGDYVIHLFDWDGAYAGDDRDVSFRITTTP